MLSQFFYYTEVYHRFYGKTIAKFIYSKSAIDKVNFLFLYRNINENIPYDNYINDFPENYIEKVNKKKYWCR